MFKTKKVFFGLALLAGVLFLLNPVAADKQSVIPLPLDGYFSGSVTPSSASVSSPCSFFTGSWDCFIKAPVYYAYTSKPGYTSDSCCCDVDPGESCSCFIHLEEKPNGGCK